jgi:hypothetical protein
MDMSDVFENLRFQANTNLPMSCGTSIDYKDLYGNDIKDGVVSVYVIIEYIDMSRIVTLSSMSICEIEIDDRLELSNCVYKGITPRLRVKNGIEFPKRYEEC